MEIFSWVLKSCCSRIFDLPYLDAAEGDIGFDLYARRILPVSRSRINPLAEGYCFAVGHLAAAECGGDFDPHRRCRIDEQFGAAKGATDIDGNIFIGGLEIPQIVRAFSENDTVMIFCSDIVK